MSQSPLNLFLERYFSSKIHPAIDQLLIAALLRTECEALADTTLKFCPSLGAQEADFGRLEIHAADSVPNVYFVSTGDWKRAASDAIRAAARAEVLGVEIVARRVDDDTRRHAAHALEELAAQMTDPAVGPLAIDLVGTRTLCLVSSLRMSPQQQDRALVAAQDLVRDHFPTQRTAFDALLAGT